MMMQLIQQIKNGKLWGFSGGIYPAENKVQSLTQPLLQAAVPREIVLPFKQHIGSSAQLIVRSGDHVLKGQALTQSSDPYMLPIHASTSGEIISIEERPIPHPSGLSEPCIIIKSDGEDRWIEKDPIGDFTSLSPQDLTQLIHQAGIAGLGGAGFPSAKKIQSAQSSTDILIINAAECEPYITADDMLMQAYADEIISGIKILEHILQPKLTIIGIESNKSDAIQSLEKAAIQTDIVIRVIPSKYPSGGEKQLIKILTNLEVPNGGIPSDIGIFMHNVASVFAIKRAIIDGEPLIERVVTLTGKAFPQPRNLWVRLGTPIQSLFDQFNCHIEDSRSSPIIIGGPLMGFSAFDPKIPVTKKVNCILVPTADELRFSENELACIRCGKCAEVCPASLLPQQLFWHAQAQEFDKLEALNLSDCIECGACGFVCPSNIPLVQYYRQAKSKIHQLKEKQIAAERAKIKFEERNQRLQKEKQARSARLKNSVNAQSMNMKGDQKMAINAAIARIKAKKEADKKSKIIDATDTTMVENSSNKSEK